MSTNDLPDYLLEFLLKSTIALAFGFLLIAVLRKLSPTWKHGVWLRVFVASLVLPLLLLLPRWEVIPNLQQEEVSIPESTPVASPISSVETEMASEGEAIQSPVRRFEVSFPWILACLWIAGVLALLLRSVAAGLYLKRIARQAQVAPSAIRAKVHEICASMKLERTVTVIVSSAIISPFTWGLFRPRIVLPDSVEGWSDSDLEMILLHELEHVRRRDALAVFISRIFLILNWVNPVAWLAIRQTVRFREEACDDRVLQAGHHSESYAEMLFRQARTASAPFLQTCATAVAETGTIEKRIQMILSPHTPSSSRSGIPIIAKGAAALLVTFILLVGMAGREQVIAQEESKTVTAVSDGGDSSTESDADQALDAIEKKLEEIMIPSIEFKETPLKDALAFLRQKSVELDDTTTDRKEKGINIVIGSDVGEAAENTKITLRLTNVPLTEALRYTASLAQLKFRVEPHAVVIRDISTPDSELYTNVYEVPPGFLLPRVAAGATPSEKKDAKQILEEAGITFLEGTSVIYNPSKSQLIVRNTQDQMELVAAFIEWRSRENKNHLMEDVKKGWEKPQEKGSDKMNSIILQKIEFADTPFPDAIRFLQQRSVELDPEKKGFNIILDSQSAQGDPKSLKITLRLSNVPFSEALRYTCSLARFEYVVEPNAIVIRPEKKE